MRKKNGDHFLEILDIFWTLLMADDDSEKPWKGVSFL